MCLNVIGIVTLRGDKMNLEFNIAIHVMCFLVKHKGERWSSKALSESVCIHPVQIRRVTTQLIEAGLIETHRGKQGGYQANQHTANASLKTLYDMFVPQHMTDQRLLTGASENACLISREIGGIMTTYYDAEFARSKAVYEGQTIHTILEKILKESTL